MCQRLLRAVHLVVHRRRVGPDLVSLVLSYSKKSGTTSGEDLVRAIDSFVNNYELKGRVIEGVTDR